MEKRRRDLHKSPAAPKVSICVITYNHGGWLRECVESIVGQHTDFEFEVIVGDDCSTDSESKDILAELAERYPTKVVALLRDANMGGGGTQNWLDVISRAKGEYIAHMDGDDRMLPGKLQKQVDFLDANKDCSMVAHDLRVFDADTGVTIPSGFSNKLAPPKANLEYLLLNGCYFGHSSKMFRRQAIVTASSELPIVDFYMHVEHASRGCIGYIPEQLGEYRKSKKSKTGSSDGVQLIADAYERSFDRALQLGCDEIFVAKGRMNFRYGFACDLLRAKNYEYFTEISALKWQEWPYASNKHRILSLIRRVPKVCALVLRFKERNANPRD